MNTPRWFARRPLVITAVAAALALIGLVTWLLWPTDLDRLADRDPHAAKACEILMDWLEDPDIQEVEMRFDAGEEAAQAVDDLIAASASEVDGSRLDHHDPSERYAANISVLWEGCTEQGIDMPPL